jgi:glycosyltransferase involved in cell wall biosynthesis
MNKHSLPTVSILIPTLNSARVLRNCLASIASQDYPREKIEVLIADGGSTDNTLKIAEKFRAKVYRNPLRTGEAGKAKALQQASGELVALIDSDNCLPEKSWLKQMTAPFSDPEILGSEPWKFTYRRKDGYLNRYSALIGMNDPYCLFVGNYDKLCGISGRWTGLKILQKDKGNFLKVKIEGKTLPTIGANGTIWRKRIIEEAVGGRDYLFDTDVLYILAARKPFYFAKVKVGIIHDFCHHLKDFYRKQKRRAKDFFYLEKKATRTKTYQKQLAKQLYFVFASILFLPLLYQAIKGCLKKPDWVWFFHPLACWITLWVYGTQTVLAFFRTTEMDRKGWGQ